MNAADAEAMAVLTPRQLEPFIPLLDAVREANAERGAPKTMTSTR